MVLGTMLTAAPLAAHAQAEKLERAVEAQIEVDREARASQQRVDRLDDETQKLLAEYLTAMPNQNLTSDEARQVVEYLRTQSSGDGPERQHE